MSSTVKTLCSMYRRSSNLRSIIIKPRDDTGTIPYPRRPEVGQTFGAFSKETAYEYEKVPRVRLGHKRWRNQSNGQRQGNHRLLRRLREESAGKPRAIRGRDQVTRDSLFRPARRHRLF